MFLSEDPHTLSRRASSGIGYLDLLVGNQKLLSANERPSSFNSNLRPSSSRSTSICPSIASGRETLQIDCHTFATSSLPDKIVRDLTCSSSPYTPITHLFRQGS